MRFNGENWLQLTVQFFLTYQQIVRETYALQILFICDKIRCKIYLWFFQNSQMLSSSSDNSTSGHELGIIRQFPFASTLQRAGVLVKPLQSGPKDLIAYFKGAPEVIADLCTSVPSSFDYVLRVDLPKIIFTYDRRPS